MVIGVDPQCQKRGVGGSMMEGFERLILSKGFSGISVSTLTDNEGGNRAFRKAGYKLSWVDDDKNHYIKHLTEKDAIRQ